MPKKLPELSKKPEPATGRYYCSYRNERNQPRKQRFTSDRRESMTLLKQWLERNYTPTGDRRFNNGALPEAAKSGEQPLLEVCEAFLNHEWKRVRGPDDERRKYTITPGAYRDTELALRKVGEYLAEHHPEEFNSVPFNVLLRAHTYSDMMLAFSKKYSTSQVNKIRNSFWALARYAGRYPPFEQRLSFSSMDVEKFGGATKPKRRPIPSKQQIQQLCRYTDAKGRLWIWLAIGFGFGPTDLAHCRPSSFDRTKYYLPRSKTGEERGGTTWPFVWTLLRDYLKACPRERDKLLFVTKNGLPIVRAEAKTEEECRLGTATRPPSENKCKETNTVLQWWKKLRKTANVQVGGFYTLRHLGCTAYALRKDVSLLDVRTFMGHATSTMADTYLKNLTPNIETVAKWVNKVLSSSDSMAWEDDLEAFVAAQALVEQRRSQKGKRHRRKKLADQDPED